MEEIVFFESIEKTLEDFYIQLEHKAKKIIIDFGDLNMNPHFLNFMLKLQRISNDSGVELYFIISNEETLKFLMTQGYKKYFNVFKTKKEYENLKTYLKYQINVYDDNNYSLDLIEDILIREGFKVVGEDENAFELLGNREINCKVIIVDFNKNISEKIDVIKQIKNSTENIAIILMVNENTVEKGLETMKYGVEEVIKKHFKREEFLNSIKRIIVENNLKDENQKLIDKVIKREAELSKLYANLENELKLASDIQQNIMPPKKNTFKDYEIEYLFEPSQDIGGDFCDILSLDENKFAVVFADISGHGIPASLLSSMLKVYIMNYAYQNIKTNDLMELLNEEIIKVFPKGKFVSLFYLIIDTETNKMKYCKASQENALFYSSNQNEILELKTEGQVLGLFSKKIFPEAVNFEEKEIEFNIKDRLILFTDGITEAESKSEEYYGIDRLKGVVWNNLEDPEILQKIRQDLKDFTNVNRLEDDLTLLTIRRISN